MIFAGEASEHPQQIVGDDVGPSDGLSNSQQPTQSQGLQLGTIESHWQTETDFYAATVALDFLSFAFVALFYQVLLLLRTTIHGSELCSAA